MICLVSVFTRLYPGGPVWFPGISYPRYLNGCLLPGGCQWNKIVFSFKKTFSKWPIYCWVCWPKPGVERRRETGPYPQVVLNLVGGTEEMGTEADGEGHWWGWPRALWEYKSRVPLGVAGETWEVYSKKRMHETCKTSRTWSDKGGRVGTGRVHRLRKGITRTGNMAHMGSTN